MPPLQPSSFLLQLPEPFAFITEGLLSLHNCDGTGLFLSFASSHRTDHTQHDSIDSASPWLHGDANFAIACRWDVYRLHHAIHRTVHSHGGPHRIVHVIKLVSKMH